MAATGDLPKRYGVSSQTIEALQTDLDEKWQHDRRADKTTKPFFSTIALPIELTNQVEPEDEVDTPPKLLRLVWSSDWEPAAS